LLTKTNNKKIISNSLQDLLLDRNQKSFWKLWKSKFGNKKKFKHLLTVRAMSSPLLIYLQIHTVQTLLINNVSTDTSTPSPRVTLLNRLASYEGDSFNYDSITSIDVIEKFILNFSCGKAAGFDHLTADH